MTRKVMNYYGKIFLSNDCGYYQIVLANNLERMKAIFLQTNTEVWVNADQVDTGAVLDRFTPTVLGVGYLGDDVTVDENGVRSRAYSVWKGMLERCYGERELEAYKYCIVSEEFHNATYFKDWYESQKGSCMKDFQLDKDILSEGCKIYAEDTCVLVPKEINIFFANTGARTHSSYNNKNYPIGVSWCRSTRKFKSTYNNGGDKQLSYHDNEWSAFLAYKKAKENRAKELAEKWRGQIDDRVYEKLINYKVLLTD